MEAQIKYHKTYLSVGIFLCTICIILGAFGAHALKSMLGPSEISTWKLGTEYQFLHGFAIIILSLFTGLQSKMITWSFRFFLLGIILFSGSLYLLTFKSVLQEGFINFIGPLTPIGGLSFILGWVFFLIAITKHKQ